MRLLYTIFACIGLFFIANSQNKIPSDTLRWQDNRKLTWEDFKGESIDAPGFMGEIFCLLPSRYKKDSPFSKLKYEVLAVMDKNASWIHSQRKNDLALKFFQLHFDLFECYARQMRKTYAETKFGADPSQLFNKIYDTHMGSLTLELKQMKKDTKMGSDLSGINIWREKVDKDLQMLSQFNNTL